MKKNYILSGVALLLVIIYVAIFAFTYQSDNLKFKNEYEKLNNSDGLIEISIDKDNNLKYASIDKVFDILEKGTGIIYFGFPSCPWCRNIIPTLLDVAKEKQETVYYFNPRDIREDGSDNYDKLLNILNNYLSTDENGTKKLYVPDVYFVKNGKIMGNHLGSLDSQEDPRIALTNEQQKELKNIFEKYVEKIK